MPEIKRYEVDNSQFSEIKEINMQAKIARNKEELGDSSRPKAHNGIRQKVRSIRQRPKGRQLLFAGGKRYPK